MKRNIKLFLRKEVIVMLIILFIFSLSFFDFLSFIVDCKYSCEVFREYSHVLSMQWIIIFPLLYAGIFFSKILKIIYIYIVINLLVLLFFPTFSSGWNFGIADITKLLIWIYFFTVNMYLLYLYITYIKLRKLY